MTGYKEDVATPRIDLDVVTLRIDLNRLRGDRVVTRRDFVEGGSNILPNLSKGEVIRVIEE